MVRLQENKSQKSIPRRERDVEDRSDDKKQANPEGGELEKFSQLVLKQLIEESIPPTPTNFGIYFEKLLEQKPLVFKKRINELLEAENDSQDDQRAKMERDVREGFEHIKIILQYIATIYKNLNIMKTLAAKRLEELKINSGQLTIQNIVLSFSNDLTKLTVLIDKQLNELKSNYEKAGNTLKSIEQEAIFDPKFGVYNKKYLVNAISNEKEAITKYNYASTIMFIKVKDSVLSKIVNAKDRSIVLRNISKLLLKTSRRSDILAHCGDGIFAMLMKHTNIDGGKKACERIAELIYATNFFIGEFEIETDIELCVIPIRADVDTEVIIISAINALYRSGRNLDLYSVVPLQDDEPKAKS